MKKNSIQDKVMSSLFQLTQNGTVPVTAAEVAAWLVQQLDSPSADQEAAWYIFAAALPLTKKKEPNYAALQKVRQVLHRLHAKCRCSEIHGAEGELLWNLPAPPKKQLPQKGLPKLQTAYRVSARIRTPDGVKYTQEYIVKAATPIGARSKIRIFLLSSVDMPMGATYEFRILDELNLLD